MTQTRLGHGKENQRITERVHHDEIFDEGGDDLSSMARLYIRVLSVFALAQVMRAGGRLK